MDNAVGLIGIVGEAQVLGDRFVSIRHGPLRQVLDDAEAQGCEWLLPLPVGWKISPRLSEILSAGMPAGSSKVIYWDHDRMDAGLRSDPVFKPDWDPLLQESVDLLSGAAMLRLDSAIAQEERGARNIGEALVAMALQDDAAVLHVPLVLTHASEPLVVRSAPDPVSTGDEPGVTVIIPTRDGIDLLEQCLAGVFQVRFSGPVEVIIIDNDSAEDRSRAYLADLAATGRCRVVPFPGKFNFAAMINHGAALASQPILCLLNNDIEMRDHSWLARMVAHARLPRCGAIGARLLYPDGTVQHAGVAIGIGDAAGHVAKGADPNSNAHRIWHCASRRVSAVTAACLVVGKERFFAVGGMDATRFAVDFNDVDLCLRLQQAGYENRVVAETNLIHHESKSRGVTRSGAAKVRFEAELNQLRNNWDTGKTCDPWHHPSFRRESQECLLQF